MRTNRIRVHGNEDEDFTAGSRLPYDWLIFCLRSERVGSLYDADAPTQSLRHLRKTLQFVTESDPGLLAVAGEGHGWLHPAWIVQRLGADHQQAGEERWCRKCDDHCKRAAQKMMDDLRKEDLPEAQSSKKFFFKKN